MDLNQILVFAKVVEAGSFIGASRELGMPTSTVSRKISELEERLGARLLHRTTRSLRLTDIGHAFHQRAQVVVAAAEEAEAVVSHMQGVPRGLLRITAPFGFAYLGPIVTSFLERHPEVQVEMVGADRVVDLIHEGFDLAIRAGRLADSSLVARPLGVLHHYLVASPNFLAKNGTPTEPRDLETMDCVVFGGSSGRARWTLHGGRTSVEVEARARYVVNDFSFVDEAALAGLGVAMLPEYRCGDHFRAGRLVRVLPDWCSPEIPLHVVYPSARHLSPKVKAFVDHIRERSSPPPWQTSPAS